MRQLCNVSFALQAETMDKKEYDKFVRQLPLEPKQTKVDGARTLMQMMGGLGGGKKKPSGRGRASGLTRRT